MRGLAGPYMGRMCDVELQVSGYVSSVPCLSDLSSFVACITTLSSPKTLLIMSWFDDHNDFQGKRLANDSVWSHDNSFYARQFQRLDTDLKSLYLWHLDLFEVTQLYQPRSLQVPKLTRSGTVPTSSSSMTLPSRETVYNIHNCFLVEFHGSSPFLNRVTGAGGVKV
jgi:hypothetical protein